MAQARAQANKWTEYEDEKHHRIYLWFACNVNVPQTHVSWQHSILRIINDHTTCVVALCATLNAFSMFRSKAFLYKKKGRKPVLMKEILLLQMSSSQKYSENWTYFLRKQIISYDLELSVWANVEFNFLRRNGTLVRRHLESSANWTISYRWHWKQDIPIYFRFGPFHQISRCTIQWWASFRICAIYYVMFSRRFDLLFVKLAHLHTVSITYLNRFIEFVYVHWIPRGIFAQLIKITFQCQN